KVIGRPVHRVVDDLRTDKLKPVYPGRVIGVSCRVLAELLVPLELCSEFCIFERQRVVDVAEEKVFTDVLGNTVQAGDHRARGIKEPGTLVVIILDNHPDTRNLEKEEGKKGPVLIEKIEKPLHC